MKYRQTTLVILAVLSASMALADDFKTINGKEYKNVTVSRVEADGLVLRTKSGISKVYFSELPKEVQERFRSKPAQGATAQPKPEQVAQRRREEEARLARENSNAFRKILFVTIFVIAIFVTAIIAIVAVIKARNRREKGGTVSDGKRFPSR